MKLNKTLFSVILLAAITCFAQDANRTQIEFEKTVSVSVPDGFLVDAEKNDNNRKYRILYYKGNFQIELIVYKSDNSKNEIYRYPVHANDSETVETDKVVARRLIFSEYYFKSNTILISTKKYFYNFRVQMKNQDDPTALRFINSIKINGKSAFPQKVEPTTTTEISMLDTELKTSPEVMAALNRRVIESDEYIKAASSDEIMKNPKLTTANYTSQPIFIEEPFALVMKKLIPQMLSGKSLGEVTVSLQLLANGEIGQVSVFSTADEKTTKMVVRSMRAIKFIPAQIDGKNADYYFFIKNNLNLTNSLGNEGSIIK
jgi:hypothetical protein